MGAALLGGWKDLGAWGWLAGGGLVGWLVGWFVGDWGIEGGLGNWDQRGIVAGVLAFHCLAGFGVGVGVGDFVSVAERRGGYLLTYSNR